jgi:hypothetical protein
VHFPIPHSHPIEGRERNGVDAPKILAENPVIGMRSQHEAFPIQGMIHEFVWME